jgi:ceramide glucosyltransferase
MELPPVWPWENGCVRRARGVKILAIVQYLVLIVASIPLVYYVLAIYSTFRFFEHAKHHAAPNTDFLPPVSCLKPIKGLDEDAYDNYASFCRQDYPEYEIVFCVDPGDPAMPLLERLIKEFPDRKIRLLFGSGRDAINDKVGRLYRLTNEAAYDVFIITDGDVRVGPDYIRSIVSAFRDPKVGAATCLYVSTKETNLVQELQTIGMISDFFAPVLVAWQLDDLKVTFGQTIATTRKAVQSYGGYQVIEDRPADDVYAGRLVAEQGYEVKLLPYIVHSVADFNTFSDLLHKRTRWLTVQRLMRPWGHFGLIFTWGLPWALVAIAAKPTVVVAAIYLGAFIFFRVLITWMIGVWGMKQNGIWHKMPLIPLWDAMAFVMWIASFGRRTIRWRGVDYFLREGKLIAARKASS